MLNKVRIKLKSDIRSKLAFVKAVKVYTGWGLKESKDFTDTLCDDFRNKRERSSELILKNSHDFKSFLRDLKDIGVDAYITGGIEWERDFKMLSLGIGEKEDYIDFIFEYIKGTPYDEDIILNIILSKLNKDELNNIINEIKTQYDSNL